jgi:drug/metabolite transporter (DMT)-like permease
VGELLALFSALSFALSGILLRLGQSQRPRDNGLFMTTLINLGLYLVLTIGLLGSSGLPPGLAPASLAFFVLAGFTNSLLGRWAWLQSVRHIGPSRATSLKSSSPIFATALAFGVLGQAVSPMTLAGTLAVVAGVFVLTHEAARAATARTRVAAPGAAAASGRAVGASGSAVSGGGWVARRLSGAGLSRGILLGLLSAAGYGSGAVLRKLGLNAVPAPILGALVGAVVALSSVLVSDLVRGNLGQRWSDNLRHVPLPFVGAGVLAGIGQLSAIASLLYTSVAASTTIASVEPTLTLLLAVLIFRALDNITPRSVVGMLCMSAGVVAVVLS